MVKVEITVLKWKQCFNLKSWLTSVLDQILSIDVILSFQQSSKPRYWRGKLTLTLFWRHAVLITRSTSSGSSKVPWTRGQGVSSFAEPGRDATESMTSILVMSTLLQVNRNYSRLYLPSSSNSVAQVRIPPRSAQVDWVFGPYLIPWVSLGKSISTFFPTWTTELFSVLFFTWNVTLDEQKYLNKRISTLVQVFCCKKK